MGDKDKTFSLDDMEKLKRFFLPESESKGQPPATLPPAAPLQHAQKGLSDYWHDLWNLGPESDDVKTAGGDTIPQFDGKPNPPTPMLRPGTPDIRTQFESPPPVMQNQLAQTPPAPVRRPAPAAPVTAETGKQYADILTNSPYAGLDVHAEPRVSIGTATGGPDGPQMLAATQAPQWQGEAPAAALPSEASPATPAPVDAVSSAAPPTPAPATPPEPDYPKLPATPANFWEQPAASATINDTTSRSDLELQKKQSELDVQKLQAKADQETKDLATEIAAKALADKRIKDTQMAQDRARSQMESAVNELTRVAQQGVRERPGNSDRATGQTLLAIAAGMGSDTAANIFRANQDRDELNQKMDVQRFQANIGALGESANGQRGAYEALGTGVGREQAMADAQAFAREKMNILTLKTKIDQFAPGEAKLAGIATYNKLGRDLADRMDASAKKQVEFALEWKRLNPTITHAAAGPEPDPAGKTREEYAYAHSQWELRTRQAGTSVAGAPYPGATAATTSRGTPQTSPTTTPTPDAAANPGSARAPRVSKPFDATKSPVYKDFVKHGMKPTDAKKAVEASLGVKKAAGPHVETHQEMLDRKYNEANGISYGTNADGTDKVIPLKRGASAEARPEEKDKMKALLGTGNDLIDTYQAIAYITVADPKKEIPPALSNNPFMKSLGADWTDERDSILTGLYGKAASLESVSRGQGALAGEEFDRAAASMAKRLTAGGSPEKNKAISAQLMRSAAGSVSSHLDTNRYDLRGFNQDVEGRIRDINSIHPVKTTKETAADKAAAADEGAGDFQKKAAAHLREVFSLEEVPVHVKPGPAGAVYYSSHASQTQGVKEEYQTLASHQVDLNAGHSDFMKAWNSGDLSAAAKAYERIEKAQNGIAESMTNIVEADPKLFPKLVYQDREGKSILREDFGFWGFEPYVKSMLSNNGEVK